MVINSNNNNNTIKETKIYTIKYSINIYKADVGYHPVDFFITYCVYIATRCIICVYPLRKLYTASHWCYTYSNTFLFTVLSRTGGRLMLALFLPRSLSLIVKKKNKSSSTAISILGCAPPPLPDELSLALGMCPPEKRCSKGFQSKYIDRLGRHSSMLLVLRADQSPPPWNLDHGCLAMPPTQGGVSCDGPAMA